jgi:hypothetical protein
MTPDRRRRRTVDDAPPVFVDRTGRRRRLMVTVGAVLATGLLASIGLLVAGLFTGASVPLPGWPEPGRGDGMGVGRLGRPTATQPARPEDQPVTTTPEPSRAAQAPTPAELTVSPSDRPGRGDERRASPSPRRGKPSQPPGKPG